jgi:hypothetical protein
VWKNPVDKWINRQEEELLGLSPRDSQEIVDRKE